MRETTEPLGDEGWSRASEGLCLRGLLEEMPRKRLKDGLKKNLQTWLIQLQSEDVSKISLIIAEQASTVVRPFMAPKRGICSDWRRACLRRLGNPDYTSKLLMLLRAIKLPLSRSSRPPGRDHFLLFTIEFICAVIKQESFNLAVCFLQVKKEIYLSWLV